jgi:hypothetical protein
MTTQGPSHMTTRNPAPLHDWGKHFREVSKRGRATCGATKQTSAESRNSSGPQFGGSSFGRGGGGHGGGGGHSHGGHGYGRFIGGGGYYGYGWPGYYNYAWDDAYPYAPYPYGYFGEDSRTYPGGLFGSQDSDALIAYRKLWDPYVTASLRAMNLASQSLINVSKNPPAGFTAKELLDLAKTYSDQASTGITAWNQFAGLTTKRMTSQSNAAVKAFMGIVQAMKQFWADDNAGKLHVMQSVHEPPQPSPVAQAEVQRLIDASGILTKSDLELAFDAMWPDFHLPHIPRYVWIAGGVVLASVAILAVKAAAGTALRVATAGVL